MIRNYLKITYRNLIRQKAFAFINIFGLAIGLACSILIGFYVKYEYSFDRFHKDFDRLYRVTLDFKMGSNVLEGPISPGPMAAEIVKQIPEAEEAARLLISGNKAIRVENRTYYEDLFFFADSNIFQIFNITFIEGNPSTALTRPYSAVITRPASEKYFGTVHSLGKTFRITNADTCLYEVTGVVEPFPDNCHFHFNVLTSMEGYADSKVPFWLSNNYYTYIKVQPATDEKEFSRKLSQLFEINANPQLLKYFNATANDFLKAGNRSDYGIQKVSDIHLKSNLNFEIEANGSSAYVSIFILVALFVLLNACINFTNLSTARSAIRAKEVGMRKVMGSDRKNLIIQFLLESIIISYIAVLFAILMVEILLPYFNNLLNANLHPGLAEYLEILPCVIIFATIVGIISGAYPAFYLSSFKPYEVLRYKFNQGPSRNWLRNTLVIVQFTFSIMILLGTLLVAMQLHYLQNKKLGFDKSRLMVIERTDPVKKNMKVFMDELQRCPAIESMSLSTNIPGRGCGDRGYTVEGRSTKDIFVINNYGVNYDYLTTMGIHLKHGRFFSREYPSDSMAVVINESAARYIGMENPVGKHLIITGRNPEEHIKLTIIGVIDDFHFESLHKPVNPLLFYLAPYYYDGYVNIRFSGGREKDVLEFVTLTWKNLSPDSPLQYFYFGDQFEKMYKKEIETRRLMNVLALISILIASLGLFGLMAFMVERRTKEIGVRKVMGSSIWKIVKLMTSEITVLVLISYVVAAPLAYFWMKHWLYNFAYQTGIPALLFIFALLIAITVAWLTIVSLAVKSAMRNPVEALRYE